jgi:hypothetical protein
MNQKYDLLGLGLALFSAAIISVTAIVGPVFDESKSKGLYDFIKDWQTLIAGAFALIAALIAAYPVRKQLLKMNLQSAIMSRNVLSQRLSDIEIRKRETKELLESITTMFFRDIYFGDPEGPPEFNSHWAFEAQRTVGFAISKLVLTQESKKDPQNIDSVRELVLRSSRSLEECLDAIHRPDSMNMDDPDYDLSDNQIAEIQANSEIERVALPEKISKVSEDSKKLDTEFEIEIGRLRKRIRQIDDLVITDELGA